MFLISGHNWIWKHTPLRKVDLIGQLSYTVVGICCATCSASRNFLALAKRWRGGMGLRPWDNGPFLILIRLLLTDTERCPLLSPRFLFTWLDGGIDLSGGPCFVLLHTQILSKGSPHFLSKADTTSSFLKLMKGLLVICSNARHNLVFSPLGQMIIAFSGLCSALHLVHDFHYLALDVLAIGCHHDPKQDNILMHNISFLLAEFDLPAFKDSNKASDTSFKHVRGDYVAPECEDVQNLSERRVIGRLSDLNFHEAGWLRKNTSSFNIGFFHHKHDSWRNAIGKSYFVGFLYTRPRDDNAFAEYVKIHWR